MMIGGSLIVVNPLDCRLQLFYTLCLRVFDEVITPSTMSVTVMDCYTFHIIEVK